KQCAACPRGRSRLNPQIGPSGHRPVVKRIMAGLALVGAALAAAFVKGVFGKVIDSLGWIGLVICFGIIGFLVVLERTSSWVYWGWVVLVRGRPCHGGPAMKAYSMDLRARVLAACDDGRGTAEAAEAFAVSPAWVRRIKQRRRETGEVAPRTPARRGPAPALA